MGIIKDVLDVIKDITNSSKDAGGIFTSKTKSSISKEASHGVLQFPVLASRGLELDNINMITKALEKNYAAFIQIVISFNPTFSFDGNSNLTDYIRQFHQNTDTKEDVFDIKNLTVSISTKENINLQSNENGYILSIVSEGDDGKNYHINKELLKGLFDDINMEILNNKVKPQKEFFINSRIASDEFKNKYSDDNSYVQKDIYSRRVNNSTLVFVSEKASIDKKQMDSTLPKDVLKWNQVQKLNELMPTQLIVKVKSVTDDVSGASMEFIIGVKTTTHPIDSKEMVHNMVSACRNNNKIFSFIKWTTGEISFFKDFLFNLNEIKDDVVNRSSGSSSWWITLKRRRTVAKLKKFIFLPNNIMPNATIVLSMEEVNFIKSEYGFDLMSPYFLDNIMKTYFLLGFVVIDNSTQTVHILFDGNTTFQTYTFSGLQRETDSKEDFKQMLKLINRI